MSGKVVIRLQLRGRNPLSHLNWFVNASETVNCLSGLALAKVMSIVVCISYGSIKPIPFPCASLHAGSGAM